MNTLKDKVILVCGGATGIGAATVGRLDQAGASIVIGDINLVTAEHVADSCSNACAIEYDQADEAAINAMVQQAVERFGQLDGLFANVADLQTVLSDADILTNPAAIWERTLAVNVTGTAMLIKACLPHLLERGGGGIVCTSSGASRIGEPERPAYAASKAAIDAICRHVAARWGKQGIRCNSLAPGLVVTPMIEQGMGQELLDRVLRAVPSPRHGEVDDIAAAVAFLLSDDGAWVNGQTWHVNGGVYFGN